jgi:hypothetical protein
MIQVNFRNNSPISLHSDQHAGFYFLSSRARGTSRDGPTGGISTGDLF